MATDTRIRVTKQMIRESFLRLLEQEPLDKISVTRLCKEAEINRVTFYKYYADVFDLYEKTVDALIEASALPMRDVAAGSGLKAAIQEVLEETRDHIDRYRVLFSEHIDFYHRNIGYERCISKIASLHTPGPVIPEEQMVWLRTFLSCGGGGVVAAWVNGGMKEPPEVIAEQLYLYIDQILKLYPGIDQPPCALPLIPST